jgi:hypothetical protein
MNIFTVFALLLILLNIVVKLYNIKSKVYTYILLFAVALGIIIANVMKNKCDNNNSFVSAQQCVIGKNKLYNGLLHGGCFDMFHIMHVLLWCIVGQLMPNAGLTILGLSILWETFEHYGFQYLCKTKNVFQGRVEDIFLNIIGYSIGASI